MDKMVEALQMEIDYLRERNEALTTRCEEREGEVIFLRGRVATLEIQAAMKNHPSSDTGGPW